MRRFSGRWPTASPRPRAATAIARCGDHRRGVRRGRGAGRWPEAALPGGRVSLGTVYLLFRYTSLLREPLDQIAEQQQGPASPAPPGAVLDEHTVAVDRPRALPAGPLGVDLDRVSFGYPNGARVLHEIATPRARGVLGVVGHTGSGKTTLTRLLLRLLEPDAGIVRVGGTDVRDVRIGELRRRVALVTQDVQLFDTTVRDNLTLFGAYQAGDRELVGVLAELGLGPWYRALPDGLDSMLGPAAPGCPRARPSCWRSRACSCGTRAW